MPRKPKPPPNLDRLRELLDYDPETGEFRWRTSGKGRSGLRAGNSDPSHGYIRIMVEGRSYYAHRLALLLAHGVMPPDQVDHINGCRADNRLINLRCATHAENARNHQKTPKNTTGFKGVVRSGRKFVAQIKSNGKVHYLGIFSVAEDAHAAYCDAASKLYGEFARFQ